jgi:hypothetical protein
MSSLFLTFDPKLSARTNLQLVGMGYLKTVVDVRVACPTIPSTLSARVSQGIDIMMSDKKIEANRRNALKSTGPRTTEGKAAVRLNALRHGLRSEEVLLSGEDVES